MIRLVGKKLIIPRGDTGSFSIPVITNFTQSDAAIFTIIDLKTNKKIKSITCQFNNNDNTFTISFTHQQTVNLPVGKFYWDIKSYKNPTYTDEQLTGGVEIDSYYAAYQLPVCQVRQTGDSLLTADNAPTSTLTPENINLLNSVVNTIQQSINNYFTQEGNLILGKGTEDEVIITPQQLKALLALLQ